MTPFRAAVRAGLLAASGSLRSELGASFVLSALSPFPACTTRGASRRFLFGGRDLVLCFLLSNRNFAFRVERWWTCYVNHPHDDTAAKSAGKSRAPSFPFLPLSLAADVRPAVPLSATAVFCQTKTPDRPQNHPLPDHGRKSGPVVVQPPSTPQHGSPASARTDFRPGVATEISARLSPAMCPSGSTEEFPCGASRVRNRSTRVSRHASSGLGLVG